MELSNLVKVALYFYNNASFQRSVDAWWMTPNGEFIEVLPGLHHDNVAAELLGVEYPNVEENDYLELGGIKFRLFGEDLYVSLNKGALFETLKRGVELSGLPNRTHVVLSINNETKIVRVGDIIVSRSFKELFS